jgi:hypothetical protein
MPIFSERARDREERSNRFDQWKPVVRAAGDLPIPVCGRAKLAKRPRKLAFFSSGDAAGSRVKPLRCLVVAPTISV